MGKETFSVVRTSVAPDKNEAQTAPDPSLVTWDGPDDKTNPKNWSFTEKWKITVVVSAFTFMSPLTNSMIAPALSIIAHELNII